MRETAKIWNISVYVLLLTQLRQCDDEVLMGHFVLGIILRYIRQFFVMTETVRKLKPKIVAIF